MAVQVRVVQAQGDINLLLLIYGLVELAEEAAAQRLEAQVQTRLTRHCARRAQLLLLAVVVQPHRVRFTSPLHPRPLPSGHRA